MVTGQTDSDLGHWTRKQVIGYCPTLPSISFRMYNYYLNSALFV